MAEQMAHAALAATQAAGLKPNVVFVPRPSATPAQVAAAKASGVVTPLYTGSPAPMGLAYYGLSAGPGGSVVGTVLNTTSIRASVDANATGIVANDLFQTSPDSYGIQLNAVVTNVTLFGTPGYSFWTQNVVEYYPLTHFLVLVTNVWNFSSGPLSTNVFYQHGPYGTQVGTEYYYAEYFVPEAVYYPFNLNLFLNSTLTSGRDTVDFTVQLQSSAYPSEDFTTTPQGSGLDYDYVIFNSTAPGGAPLTVPSNYTANGLAYNPIGLTDDFELIFGGPGGGSQATLFAADANLGLAYLKGSNYVSVPSAFNYGGETGETVTGTSIGWSNAGGGPFGLSTYATMSTGPAILHGLWNASGAEGVVPVVFQEDPANAFNILTPVLGPGSFAANFTIAEPAIAPELYTNTFYLTPGTYNWTSELSGYAPQTQQLEVEAGGPIVEVLSLARDPALGVYTPLWAFSDAEVAAVAVAGAGTPNMPYLMPTSQPGAISSVFGLYNDYTFPAYPAVFFYDTNAITEFVNPPSFSTSTNTFAFPGPFLPAQNDLQYWFWNVSGVGVLDASNISGWFGNFAFYPAVFNTYNMIFYEGGHNLVANDTFNSQGQALLIFGGGNLLAPPFNIGGSNNTVWGNTFNEVPGPTCPSKSCEVLMPGFFGIGLGLAAPDNTVYNNAFLTPTTAWVYPLNLYSGYPFFYPNAFNITPVPGSVVNTVLGFPGVHLTGSILGPAGEVNGNPAEQGWQGGNYWWDYGLAFNPYNGANNPYGVLPYDENAPTLLVDVYGPAFYYQTYIYPGGDFAPVVPGPIWPVTVQETGLPSGSTWNITVVNPGGEYQNLSTNGTALSFDLLQGAYEITNVATGGYGAGGPSANPVNVTGSTSVTLAFHIDVVAIDESGIPLSYLARGWTVVVGGTVIHSKANAVSLVGVPNGVYDYVITGPSGYVVTNPAPTGVLTVDSANVTISATFLHGYTFSLGFGEGGLLPGTHWCVQLGGWQECSSKTLVKYWNLTAGSYAYEVVPLSGQTITARYLGAAIPLNGTLNLSAASKVSLRYVYTYAVTFTETGLPAEATWSITVHGLTETAFAGQTIVFELGNGTHSYKIFPNPGFLSSGSPKVAVVHGAPVSVQITFKAT